MNHNLNTKEMICGGLASGLQMPMHPVTPIEDRYWFDLRGLGISGGTPYTITTIIELMKLEGCNFLEKETDGNKVMLSFIKNIRWPDDSEHLIGCTGQIGDEVIIYGDRQQNE